ncbi:nickel insertion protein [Peribacillus castrilensis]
MDAGALDTFYTPVYMKEKLSGTLVTVLSCLNGL